jgi:hypothetical protein
MKSCMRAGDGTRAGQSGATAPDRTRITHRNRSSGRGDLATAVFAELSARLPLRPSAQGRRAPLAQVLDGSRLLLSRELPGETSDIVTAARGLGLKGVIAKRRDSLNQPATALETGRS